MCMCFELLLLQIQSMQNQANVGFAFLRPSFEFELYLFFTFVVAIYISYDSANESMFNYILIKFHLDQVNFTVYCVFTILFFFCFKKLQKNIQICCTSICNARGH